MENKYVGFILLGFSLLVMLNLLVFQSMLGADDPICTAETCQYHNSFNKLTYLYYGIIGVLVVIALVLIFSKPNERIVVKKVTEKARKKSFNLSSLKPEEKDVFNIIRDSKTIFQADLIEKTGLGKAKISRILDRLEGKGYVERKRRGMTNVVVLNE